MTLTPLEQKFYEQIQSHKSIKISLNLAEKTLEMIDDLANTFGLTRTLAIEAVLLAGLPAYLDLIENANTKLSAQYNKPQLNEIAKKLKDYRKRWNR